MAIHGEGGNGTLRLQRQFVPGALLSLAPNATYSVALVDKTAGFESKSVTETIAAESDFTAKEGPVALVDRFDNIEVTGPGSNPGENGGNGGKGGDGGNGANGVGRACKITVQGLLKKGKPATTKRTAKVGKGKAKQLVLKVKPAVRSKVAGRKRLLFKESVRAGSANATVYKRLGLIRR